MLSALLANYMSEEASQDLRDKSKRALKAVLHKCTHLVALEPLLREAPANIQKFVLAQFAKTLPHDVNARRAFVKSGGLQLALRIEQTEPACQEHVRKICECYPPEIVEYYSPDYADKIISKIDDFQPQVA